MCNTDTAQTRGRQRKREKQKTFCFLSSFFSGGAQVVSHECAQKMGSALPNKVQSLKCLSSQQTRTPFSDGSGANRTSGGRSTPRGNHKPIRALDCSLTVPRRSSNRKIRNCTNQRLKKNRTPNVRQCLPWPTNSATDAALSPPNAQRKRKNELARK